MNALTAGFIASLSLIIAIGAQNAYVLRLGLSRNHVGIAIALCATADVVLINLGIGGLGRLIGQLPWLLEASKWIGVCYLTIYALRSLWNARRPGALLAAEVAAPTRRTVILATLGFTFLNPHVYLDTVLLLGSIGNQYGASRWWFTLGAGAGSILWFAGLGFGARSAAGMMSRPSTWRILDLGIGVVMLLVAVSISTAHLGR